MKKHTIFIFPVKQKGMWFKKVAIDGKTQTLVKSSEDEILKEILPEMFPQVKHLFTMDYIPAWIGKKRELSDLGFDIHEQYNFDEKNTIITITEPTPTVKFKEHILYMDYGRGDKMRVWVDGLRDKSLDGGGGVASRTLAFLKTLGQLLDYSGVCRPIMYQSSLPKGWEIGHISNDIFDIVTVKFPVQTQP